MSSYQATFKNVIEENNKIEENKKSKLLESIFEDSLNEVAMLKMFQKKFGHDKRPLDHIIHMYDG